MNTIKLKDGYRFSYRDGKNFAEKNDEPGVYYCPYCYAQVESTFQSACVSCKESFALPKEKENDYTNALSEFQKAEENADNDELKAMCYENIAEIYAINRKYGTALSFASKAYKLSPSDTREMLIAKIYYQAGQTDNAITRINNALKKSFK